MSHRTHRMNRAAVGLLLLAALVIALGVWAQVQQSALAMARADAVVTQGAAGFNTVPVPILLKPFEAGLIPAFLRGNDGQGTPFGVFSRIGGAIGLLGLLLLPLRQRIAPRNAGDIVDLDADLTADLEREQPIAVAMPKVQAKTDWQFRLAQKMAAGKGPGPGTGPQFKRKPVSGVGKSLFRAALLLVGLAFIGLAATLYLGSSGIIGGVDVAALANKTLLTGRLAVAGDRSAMLAMAQVGAVMLGVLIVFKVVLSRRKPAKRRNNFAI